MQHSSPKSRWRTSSYSSGNGQCVEVGDGFPGTVPVRDSKRADSPVLSFSHHAWADFVHVVKHGA
ncbi:DUF397 domain-containing protein [Streptomyces sp. NPDC021093]|uniref:DUF397 domain-containing protein n=1 Tax=Streptomyces sp. NPDC021093 TaxID=3365112 RepID=UPI00378FBFED